MVKGSFSDPMSFFELLNEFMRFIWYLEGCEGPLGGAIP
jgi:hypothetical protein